MTTVCAIQMNSGHDVDDNLAAAEKLLAEAAQQGSKITVLPEMFAVMGAQETAKVAIREPLGEGKIQDFVARNAAKHGMWIVAGTIPLSSADKDKIFAACLVYNDQGERVAHYNKIHLFDASVNAGQEHYRESAHTLPGHDDVVVDTPWGKLGLAVCYDLRFPELFRCLLNKGAEIFAVPAAFTASTGIDHWHLLTRCRAVENLCYLIGSNQVGQHPNSRQTYGHSIIIGPWGKVLASQNDQPGIVTANIDLAHLRKLRTQMPIVQHQRIHQH